MFPALRQELSLYPGPSSGDGAPTWSLQDPVRNLFFRIDWLTFEILVRWPMGDAQAILDSIEQETAILPIEEDVDQVLQFLAQNELLQLDSPDSSGWYHQQLGKRRPSIWQWLLHRYLFFRIPLWRPDAWLSRTRARVAPLYSRGFFWLTLLALALGLMEVSRQWDGFVSTLVDTFSWQGMAGFALTLVLVKFFHELGHAYTAKGYGCRVPTMGVAFLVLFPMAYTDVNEVWKLPAKGQRLAVGAAGIITELAIAAWATLAWTLLPDGVLRNGAFLLATTTWISTLMINASPFLRFDGYFLLMDWLEVPNLHQRAFALARWRLRQWLFGLDEAAPESLPARKLRGLLLFAWITWVYRLVVFLGIALLVYYLFPKPLGPFLAAVELGWFILLPIGRELREWYRCLPSTSLRVRLWWLFWLIVLMAMAFLPWDQRLSVQGLLRPVQHFPVVAPGAARILDLAVEDGQQVDAGHLLMKLQPNDLDYQRRAARARAAGLDWQAGAVGVDARLREQQQIIEAARGKVNAELAGIEQESARYKPKAPFAGRFYFNQPDLAPGIWVGKNEQLGVVADVSRWLVETYLPENELQRIGIGDEGRFYPETPGREPMPVKVVRIDRDATRVLQQGILAASRGGAILVRETSSGAVPETALYRVGLSLQFDYRPADPRILRGQLVLFGKPTAYMDEFTRAVAALIFREAGF